MRYHVEYQRPGEKFHRVGSNEGHADLETALFWLREGMRTAVPGSVVRVVDDKGKRVASMEGGK